MDKLVERETATRSPLVAAPALAVQFFLIPLAVVGVTVLVYVGFRSLLADERSPAGLPDGDSERRHRPAVAGGVRAVAADGRPGGARRSRPRRRRWSRRSSAAKDDDPRVGGTWRWPSAGSIRRCPPEAIADLDAWRSNDPDSEARISAIWALGSSGDAAVVPTLQPLYESPDAGIRKMVVYALGALPGDAQIATLRTALAGCGARRALERGGRAGAARQPRRRAGAAADARPQLRRADGEARRRGRTTTRIRWPM